MDKELTLNLRIDTSPECLRRLCDGLAAAVRPDGGYKAATTDDPAPGTGCDTPLKAGLQMAQAEWWIPQHGCDSLENTLDAIKGRLLVAVQDWWATALVPTTPAAPERGEAGLEASFRAWYQHAYGSAYFGAMPLCVAIEWAQHLLSQPTAPAPVVVPVGQGDAIARQAYVAFVQICKGRSDDAGTYEEDEALVRRALKRLDKLESDHAIPLPQGGEGE